MESPPQNPEFRNNPENFPPCINAGPLADPHEIKGFL